MCGFYQQFIRLSQKVNISNVPIVSFDSPLKDIDFTYRMLAIKHSRDRYREFADDCILTGIGILETVFDGKKQYFGFSPDLTGYSATAINKLRKVRPQTSNLVGEFMKQIEFSPGLLLLCEFIPSMISHSYQRKQGYIYDNNNKMNQNNINSAINNIRNHSIDNS